MGVQVDVVIMLVLALLLVFFLFREMRKVSNYNETTVPKIIWILWLQGWDKAPYIARKVRESWEKHNPGWEVRAISADSEYLRDVQSVENKAHTADILRLYLLEKYGGVWADSTLLCMRSLDSWLPDMTRDCDMWMYHCGGSCDLASIWFMAAKPGSVIIKEWKKQSDEYWKDRREAHVYHWMDYVFNDVMMKDPRIQEEWAKVPKICCEAEGGSHMLAGRVNDKGVNFPEELPHVIKLSHHGFIEDDPETNGNRAIFFSLAKFNENSNNSDRTITDLLTL